MLLAKRFTSAATAVYLYRPMGDGFGTTADTDIYATSISLPSVDGNAAVRSTIMTRTENCILRPDASNIGMFALLLAATALAF